MVEVTEAARGGQRVTPVQAAKHPVQVVTDVAAHECGQHVGVARLWCDRPVGERPEGQRQPP